MNKQKISISILFLVVILVIVFIVIKSNKKVTEETNTTKPVDVSTNGTDAGVVKTTEFGGSVVFKLNDKITFSDGLNVTLKEINDSRCPKGVQCIWAGEIAGTFLISDAKLATPKEIRLGAIRNKSVVLEGYTFSLKDATVDSLTIQVVKN
ncbi:MAG: hypothetical protein WC793_02770 [Candidatus Paceibacterota bacterium]|jgi:hypothetical protein